MRRLILNTTAALAALALAGPMAGNVAAATVAITNAHIYTSGHAGEIASGTVVIRDGKIAAVGANVSVPQGAQVVDAKGATVTPGFIAADAGLGETEVGRDSDAEELGDYTAGPGDGTRDLQTGAKDLTAAFDVQYALNPASTSLPLARLAGITSAVITPEYGFGFGKSEKEGVFGGQAAVARTGGGDDLLLKGRAAMVLDLGQSGADNAGGSRNTTYIKVREILGDVRSYMHNKAAYEKNQTRPYAVSKADLEALIPVVEGRMPVLVSAHRASDIRLALRLAREEHLKIILDGAEEGWMVGPEIAEAHVPVIIDPKNDLPQDFEMVGATMENAGRLKAAGVEVIVAGGAENYRVRELRYLAGDAVAYGLPWNAALDAVTIAPARAFGVADRTGSLEPGKDADLVVWSGDPFEPLTQPLAVYIKGQPQPLTSRQTQLRDRYMDLNRPYPPAYHQ